MGSMFRGGVVSRAREWKSLIDEASRPLSEEISDSGLTLEYD